MSNTDARPLTGKTILVTRPEEGASRMGGMLADLGACVRLAPMIRITEPDDWAAADAAIRGLDAYRWIIFTSANGPKFLAKRIADLGAGPRRFPRKRRSWPSDPPRPLGWRNIWEGRPIR